MISLHLPGRRFPIYWVPQRVGSFHPPRTRASPRRGFQFIGFPSEWGVGVNRQPGRLPRVSNLLGSPASGETPSIQVAIEVCFKFPIYWVPQRVGRPVWGVSSSTAMLFPIYWVPQRVGSPTLAEGGGQPSGVSNLLGSPASGEI